MEYLEKFFKKSGLISILEAIIIAILGIIIMVNPEGTIKAISLILGLIFIAIRYHQGGSVFLSQGKI